MQLPGTLLLWVWALVTCGQPTVAVCLAAVVWGGLSVCSSGPVAGAAESSDVAAGAGPPRPNIVVFLSDDHTLRDSSVYGSTDLKTPAMERLAAAGMTFECAYVASPSCAPSRAALLTGLMPARNGAEANHSRPRADIRKWPAWFQELGYDVVSFGKVGHYAQTREYGFDHAAHFRYHEDIAIPKALEWLQARRSDRPLCLLVGTNWPHVPWPEDLQGLDAAAIRIPPQHVSTPETRRARARYYAAVTRMDSELGQVYDAARSVLGADTIFVHTSDHGAQWPFGKWTLYEDGIRTPLLVVWSGHVAAGTRTRAAVSWVDLLPTLLEMAGGQPPADIDGRSFLPVLLGQQTQHRPYIFTTHSGDSNFNVYPARSVRSEGWKYIRNLHPEFQFESHITKAPGDTGYWPSWTEKARTVPAAAAKVHRYVRRPAEELYDLTEDPLEQTNLAADPARQQRLAELRAVLDAWLLEQGDQQTVFGEPTLLPAEP